MHRPRYVGYSVPLNRVRLGKCFLFISIGRGSLAGNIEEKGSKKVLAGWCTERRSIATSDFVTSPGLF